VRIEARREPEARDLGRGWGCRATARRLAARWQVVVRSWIQAPQDDDDPHSRPSLADDLGQLDAVHRSRHLDLRQNGTSST
jgi:hypothetical protein